MQLWEQGLIDLDAPANDYLRAYRLTPAKQGFRPTTLRQLLTHSGGIPEQVPSYGFLLPDYGESVKLGRRVPSLAEYYRGSLRVAVEPGTMFIYGDHSFATLGQIVEDVSGKSLDRYFRDHIFDMTRRNTDERHLVANLDRSNVAARNACFVRDRADDIGGTNAFAFSNRHRKHDGAIGIVLFSLRTARFVASVGGRRLAGPRRRLRT